MAIPEVFAEPLSGYSTQAAISLKVAAIINNRRIGFWFAHEFNPIDNDVGSNPLRIFETLDRATKRKDRSAAKVEKILDNLKAWVHGCKQQGLVDRGKQGEALQAIKTAFEDGGLAPRVFYVDRVVRAWKGSLPDEYRIENEPVVDGCARQILPPTDGHS